MTLPHKPVSRPSAKLAVGTMLALYGALMASLMRTTTVHAAPQSPVERGAALFHVSGCEHCHGTDGRGGNLGPDLGTVGKRLTKPQIEHQIHEGGGGMPSFAEALQPDEISALVEYLSTRKKAPKKPASPTPPAAAAPTPASL